jgi:YfiH family protein
MTSSLSPSRPRAAASLLSMEWHERDGVRWLEAELPGARAAFSTRVGGVSEGPYEALNVAIRTGDEPERVRNNRGRLAGALELDPRNVLIARQVHGAEVQWHDDPPNPRVYAEPQPSPTEADAQATGSHELAPLVMVADCLPVALAGPGGVAMAHCGWRGLAGGVIERAGGTVDARAAAIGPGIGSCCYEVGPEVLGKFEDLDGVAAGRMLDLAAVIRVKLAEIDVERVETADLCTSCNPDLFYSHRRDEGRTGRQAGIAWLDGTSS